MVVLMQDGRLGSWISNPGLDKLKQSKKNVKYVKNVKRS
jgi:hypothetical protein